MSRHRQRTDIIPATQRAQSGQIIHQQAELSIQSGPLPPAEELGKYEAICPGAADRILTMAEKQQQHRFTLEGRAVQDQGVRSRYGLLTGLNVALASIGGGVYCISTGHDIAGGTIVTGSIVSLVSVFVIGSKSQKEERQGRLASLLGPKRQQP